MDALVVRRTLEPPMPRWGRAGVPSVRTVWALRGVLVLWPRALLHRRQRLLRG
ncbi:hypothetical protein JDM601_1373 [Mycolicibacter sinensis]|uniref:Uncharacterized protein n=1 Tax=Mycolicibacter sinensis (strain JDM601) TaxID=875328 RepID=F5YXA4_MYCSD|nr:hypothetical protein JDM601_1373 [Mycolicibacter sinensis]